MAVRMTKGDAIDPASLMALACLVAVVWGMPAENALGQALNHQQPQMYQQQADAVPVTFWIVAAPSLMLLGLASGAIATMMLLQRRRHAELADDASVDFGASRNGFKQRILQAAQHVRLRFQPAKLKFALRTRRAARNVKRRLRAMVPSRRLVLRVACLLVGTALVILSLVGFTTGRVLESSILLPVGYVLAASFWILSWKRPSSGPDAEEIAYLAARRATARSTPRPAAVRPQAAPRPKTISHAMPPSPHFAFTTDTVDQLHAAVAFQPLSPLPSGSSAQLQCAPCRKQFNVRGQGEIAFRLVPCPDCGSPLESLSPKRADIIPNDPNWVPIVSVFCKGCRGLIDVPYSTFGSSIACPRCQANLPVPHVTSRPHEERFASQLTSA